MKLEWPTISFFFLIHVLGIVALQQFSWSAFLMLIFLGWVTGCLGLTLGYHRLLSHRSFSVPKWLERVFATCGALSAEYGPIQWVGLHRQHHKFSDQELDPHNINRGFWWAHIGWMLYHVPGEKRVRRYTADLRKDPYYRWLDKYFLLLQIPLGIVLFYLGGWHWVLWGIPLRMVVVYHLTWCINSVVHTWGTQPFESNDNSRNNRIMGWLAFGEGWHNNHHAYPTSAKHGLQGQFDLTWYIIVVLRALRLATNVRVPKINNTNNEVL